MFLPFKAIRNKKGFTLVELIVVMAVLAIISAIAVPRFLGVQEDAKLEADYATGSMLGKAAELYLVDDKNTIDTLNAVGADLETLLKTTNIEFVSSIFEGKESTISFVEENSGAVIVKAIEKDKTEPTQLYPRLAATTTP